MTILLTNNLSLMAGGVNGIKKLRELILELAMRGKLVPQDPFDEPASELLKRINKEKARLIASGQKPAKVSLDSLEKIKHFKIPSTWCWVNFGSIAQHNSGKTLDKGRNTGVAREYITTSNLYWGRFELTNVRQMLIREDERERCTAVKNDLLICEGGEAGRAAVWDQDREICVQNHVHRARFYCDISPYFVQRYFEKLNYCGEINIFRKGVGISNMSSKALASIDIPLPPLAEQHRIVAKIDELMLLCDRLETQQADAESAHTQLVKALLGSLTNAKALTEFSESWQRLSKHFHTLFTTEPSVDALKRTLLQLAVMGKLVTQDADDEPASTLLKQIELKKQRLTTEGKLKRQKPLAPISTKEQSFCLPSNWMWARIGDVALSTEYGLSEKTSDLSDGVPVLKMGDIQDGHIILGRQMKVSKVTEGLPQLYLEEDDLLYNRTNSAELVGKTGIFAGEKNQYTFASYLIRIRCPKEFLSPAYLNISMNTPLFRETQINPHLKQQCGQANVNGTIMRNMIISVPPVAEQHRIVAKVNQLMTFCDQLKTKLTQARQLNEQLATVLVEQSLRVDNNVANYAIDQVRARTLLAAEIVQQLHCEKRMGRVKLQKVISLAEHIAQLKEIQSKEERYAAGPHDPALMAQAVQGLRENKWFEELALDDGKRYEYRPLAQSGAHRPIYEALWSTEQRRQINELIELMRPWDTARCERVATLYSAWNDLLIEGRDAYEAAILQEVLHGWNDSKLKYTETQWRAELAEMQQHSFLIPTGFGKRTSGGKLTLPGFEPSI
ncbi:MULTISPECIES: restriction endonuclease subunit S [unclassified Pseudomonas]|uniref:restriction endonuclease subunit S n=1 Tax=Pseudomonas sp. EA_65y_Pfl1_P120 TaxID=3088693 RepID=UPI0030DC4ED6